MAMNACGREGMPAKPLFAGIDGKTYIEGTRLIQRRVEALFPKGSSEPGLEAYLDQQGFQIERVADRSGPKIGVATLRSNAFICGSQIRVSWNADAAHTIQHIEALYSDTGCL